MTHADAFTIPIGALVVATRDTGVCALGEVGVCVEHYRLDNRPGWTILFERGRYDGFSPTDVRLMLHLTDQTCAAVASYRFTNVGQLAADYRAGYFNPAFAMVVHQSAPGRAQ